MTWTSQSNPILVAGSRSGFIRPGVEEHRRALAVEEAVAATIEVQRLSDVVLGPHVHVGLLAGQRLRGVQRHGLAVFGDDLAAVAGQERDEVGPPVEPREIAAVREAVGLGLLEHRLAGGGEVVPGPSIGRQWRPGLGEQVLVVVHGHHVERRGPPIQALAIDLAKAEQVRIDVRQVEGRVGLGERLHVDRDAVLIEREDIGVRGEDDVGQRSCGGLLVERRGDVVSSRSAGCRP